MKGIPLALVAERSPMLELLVIGNLEYVYISRSPYIVYVLATQDTNTLECSKKEKKKSRLHVQNSLPKEAI